jgi:single-strand DNA-binding protein
MNSIQLIGRLTAEPDRRTTPSDEIVVAMRVAVPRPGSPAQGADFFDVEAWNGLGEACANHLRAGREVAVQGRLAHREWRTKDNARRDRVVIVARAVDFLRESARSGVDDAPAAHAA